MNYSAGQMVLFRNNGVTHKAIVTSVYAESCNIIDLEERRPYFNVKAEDLSNDCM